MDAGGLSRSLSRTRFQTAMLPELGHVRGTIWKQNAAVSEKISLFVGVDLLCKASKRGEL